MATSGNQPPVTPAEYMEVLADADAERAAQGQPPVDRPPAEPVTIEQMVAYFNRVNKAYIDGALSRDARPGSSIQRLVPKPDLFYGDGKVLVTDWIYSMTLYLEATDPAEGEVLPLVTTHLRKHALTWWRSVKEDDEPKDWFEFAKALAEQFAPINPLKHARDKLAKLTQTGSVRNYISTFRGLCTEIGDVSDAEMRDKFMRGLKPSVQAQIELNPPAKFDELVAMADRIDAIQYRYSSSQRSNGVSNGNNGKYKSHSASRNVSHTGPTPMEIDVAEAKWQHGSRGNGNRQQNNRQQSGNGQKQQFTGARLTPETRQQLIREGKCLYCREPGHKALECPKRPRQQG